MKVLNFPYFWPTLYDMRSEGITYRDIVVVKSGVMGFNNPAFFTLQMSDIANFLVNFKLGRAVLLKLLCILLVYMQHKGINIITRTNGAGYSASVVMMGSGRRMLLVLRYFIL